MNSEDFDLIGNINVTEPLLGIQIGKTVLMAHPASSCAGQACCIHNPSDHPMKDFPLNWRADRGLMERICPHGIGHPDPDDLAFKKLMVQNYEAYAFGVHGCCGVCH